MMNVVRLIVVMELNFDFADKRVMDTKNPGRIQQPGRFNFTVISESDIRHLISAIRKLFFNKLCAHHIFTGFVHDRIETRRKIRCVQRSAQTIYCS